MQTHLLGAHMPIKGGLGQAVRDGKAIGCTAVQVFTSSPQQWASRPVTKDMVSKFQTAKAETGIDVVVSHDSYLVNLCAPTEEAKLKSIEGLKGELRRCGQYGIRWVVSHIGAHKGEGAEEGLRMAAESVKEVLAETPDGVMILAETTAGQGSSLNSKFEEIARLFELTGSPPRLGVCLDTCHIFVAGYDIRTAEGYEKAFSEFERLIGLSNLKAIHCNDSKKDFGTRVDRHEHIGDGFIGAMPFQLLVNDPRFFQTPILLETPEAPEGHAMNLAKLWGMVEG
ncbi:MAG: deoxyribonuclease IV [Chlorobia bacterium]|nr:deoxyribonuclease IV [Fimbriimonadaceae bacterium]